jgi:transposase
VCRIIIDYPLVWSCTKPHILVDTEGFMLKAKVHSAKIMDYEEIKALLCGKPTGSSPAFVTCGWTQVTEQKTRARTGWRRSFRVERGSSCGASPKARSQREVLMCWAREWAKEGLKVDWERLLLPKGFQVLPRRWVVERTFSWIDQNRRISKD